ncbi:hypothetical protein ABID16_000454 [Rhizobium aquaticum]|uniref:DUF982 domain-containing protein n=1 Tax=Rhizobium aquaticum TaxID=1549636 RepID=A0ABV2IUI5_9HYPH
MVTFANGAVRQFDCVHDALDCLQHEWPSPRGKRHQKATEVLASALARLAPVDEARNAFVSACVEAGILVPQLASKGRKTGKIAKALSGERVAATARLEGAG